MFRPLIFLGIVAWAVAGCACRNNQPPKIATTGTWEKIFFRGIDEISQKSGIPPLRSYGIGEGDYEIRVWRGFGTAPLEGVIIRRTGGQMSATHLRERRDYTGDVDVIQLPAPKSGWNAFTQQLLELGVFNLPFTAEDECERSQIDGTGHVIEISRDGTYGTHLYPSHRQGCTMSDQMDQVSETIGIDFDSGKERCERAEWFPCAAILRSRRLADEQQP